MRRLAALLLCLALLAPAAPALAQSSPFGPLPQPAPTETPTPDDNSSNILGQDVGRTTLYLIAGALLVAFVFIGWFISRDARRTLPQHRVSDEAERRRHDPQGAPPPAAREGAGAQEDARPEAGAQGAPQALD